MSHSFSHLLGAAVVAVAGLSQLSHAQAQTTVLDFEPAALVGLHFPGNSFTQGNYQMTTLLDFGTVDVAAALGAVAPSGNATQFYFNSNSGSVRITAVDAVPFNLNSFSAAFVPLDPPSPQTTVIVARGITMGDVEVLSWWNFASSATSSFPFADFTAAVALSNLKSLDFYACSLVGGLTCTQPTLNNGQFAIDNISITAVPEPSTVLLLTLGVLALGLRHSMTARRSQQ